MTNIHFLNGLKHFSPEKEARLCWDNKTPEEPQKGGESTNEPKEVNKGSETKPEKPMQRRVLDISNDVPTEAADLPAVWDISKNWVRPKLWRALQIGSVLAVPHLAATAYIGKQIADRTIAKVPVVGEAYTSAANGVINTARYTSDKIASVLTSPAIAIDSAENLYEGLTGNIQIESKKGIGRAIEYTIQAIGTVGRESVKLPFRALGLLRKALGEVKLENIVSIPGKLVDGYAKALANHPILTLGATAIGAGAIGTYGFAGAGAQVFDAFVNVLNSFGQWMATP